MASSRSLGVFSGQRSSSSWVETKVISEGKKRESWGNLPQRISWLLVKARHSRVTFSRRNCRVRCSPVITSS